MSSAPSWNRKTPHCHPSLRRLVIDFQRQFDFAERGICFFRREQQTADPLDRKITEWMRVKTLEAVEGMTVSRVFDSLLKTAWRNCSFRKLHL
jgi:hypothetical protein